MRVFISTSTFSKYCSKPAGILADARYEYELNSTGRKLTEEEIHTILANGRFDGLIAGTEPLTRKVIEADKDLKVISRVGVGMDNIDLKFADESGIKVYNTPDVLTDSVAELTIGLILSCLRKIPALDRNMRQNIWKKEMGNLFSGKILGIIGFGRIGKKVASLAQAFNASVIFYDNMEITAGSAKQVSKKELFEKADIISIHTSTGECILSENEINRMKNNVIIINTSRGSCVQEKSLIAALKRGKIAYAGMDVYEHEPYEGELTTLENVVCTPHIGSYAEEARIKMEEEAVKNLIRGFNECKE